MSALNPWEAPTAEHAGNFLKDEAVAGIRAGKWDFFVHNGGREVDVVIAYHGTRAYLKTRADNYLWDNLLALPDCP